VTSLFDPRTVLLAKHAQHVVLVHFPIALFITGTFFDLVGQRGRSQGLAIVAHYNFVMAATTAVPTFFTGLLAWKWALESGPFRGILLWHLAGGCALLTLMLVVAWVHMRARRRSLALPKWRFAVEFAAVVLLALTAHIGGVLSGVNA